MEAKTYQFAGTELSLREMKIIAMHVLLIPRKQMADKLFISESTLNHAICDLYKKTECISAGYLVRKALENGFDTQGNFEGLPLE